MGTTPVCQITSAGIVRPTFENVLGYMQTAYRAIYGVDVYLGADSQDGQFMALLANAIHDCNGQTVAVFNAFSPSTAQGEGLSSVVKLNGIRRKSATYSTVDLLVVGQVGSIIAAGVARDANGAAWNLPDPVVIPPTGQITVTATCQVKGAIAAPTNTVTIIATPTLGWQSVTNLSPATSGLPVETDLQLRQRQSLSTGLPANTPLDSLRGALMAVTGVAASRVYENDSNIIDTYGVPAHSIAAVVDGGDVDDIAGIMARKKTPGVGLYGDIVVPVTDAYGVPHDVGFFRSKPVKVAFYIPIRVFRGYTADTKTAIQQAVAAWVSALGIGNRLPLTRAYDAANLKESPVSAPFEIVPHGMVATRDGYAPGAPSDLEVTFYERLICDPADVNVTVVG